MSKLYEVIGTKFEVGSQSLKNDIDERGLVREDRGDNCNIFLLFSNSFYYFSLIKVDSKNSVCYKYFLYSIAESIFFGKNSFQRLFHKITVFFI